MSAEVPKVPGRILIVEDDPDSGRMLEMVLRHAGHEVSLAADGSSGIAAAAGFNPQLVLCDISLPGEMDGYAVARALRDELPDAQIIALTGYSGEEARARAVAAGFHDLIIKPVQVREVVALARTKCQERASA
jgi:CheY-like chemotaxis protein